MRRLAQLAIALCVSAIGTAAHAGCETSGEAGRVRRSLAQAMHCEQRALRAGPALRCRAQPPPACAGSLVRDATALAYGANPGARGAVDARGLRAQLRCQGRIGRAVADYVATRLSQRVSPKPLRGAEAKAARRLQALGESCSVSVAQDPGGVVLPSVGPQCAQAVGAPGARVAAASLAACLRRLGDVWVERWGPDPQPLRPNILLILTDDQRWDTTDDTHGLAAGLDVMPRLRDELAGAGVEFANAFVTTPLCCPSRASLLTGRYAHTTGVYANEGPRGGVAAFGDAETLATLLQAAGYRTSFLGKYLNGYDELWDPPAPPYRPPGWTIWSAFRDPLHYYSYELLDDGVPMQYGAAPADYATDVLRERAMRFISESAALGQPFFLLLSFNAPHWPRVPAPRHAGSFSGLSPWRPASYDEADLSDKPGWVQDTPPLSPEARDELDALRIEQLEMLQAVDEAVGGSAIHSIRGLVQHLRDLGVADDTLVAYTSDNGWQWGEHRQTRKNKPYEESIRVPLFVRYPRLAPLPRRETALALNLDLAPTLLELALRPGDPRPALPLEGASLVRVLDGTAPTWRSDFLTEGWADAWVWASVRETRWKYTELPLAPGDPQTLFEVELYDLAGDPLELENRAKDPAQVERVKAMAARLRALRPLWPLDADPSGGD